MYEHFTGLPVIIAAKAVLAQTIAAVSSLPPKPPPIGVPITSTSDKAQPSVEETNLLVLKGCCILP